MVFRGPWQNKAPDVSNRYFKEVSRIFGVLNKRLEGKEYLAGSEYTFADIAALPWVRAAALFPLPYRLRK
jgi:glutathione S-transferase